jgi:hypothetical protein
MTLPVKKIYVDSRYMTSDSTSTSNFKFQLARNVFMPQNTVFYLEDVCIPHAWHTVEADFNDTMYIYIQDNTSNSHYLYILKIPPNNYVGATLAAAIQSQLKTIDTTFTATYNINNHCITIAITNPNIIFIVPSDDELQTSAYLNYITYPIGNSILNQSDLNSWNDLIGNTNTPTSAYTASTPFVSGMLDLLGIRNIFISSPNLGSFSTMGSRGESNIIKKVPVSSDFGYLVIDSFTSPHDFLDCSRLTLGTIEFNLRDVKGKYIPLHGGHVSFSIVFSSVNNDG